MRIAGAAAVVLIAACSAERSDHATTTIAPADPRPAPSTTATAAFAEGPVVTTAGSPRPAAARATVERVFVDDGGITGRPLVPRGDAVFELENRGRLAHSIVMGGSYRVLLESGAKQMVTLDLREPSYTIRCDVPGHDEEFLFRTYEPR